jgi:hypothetical protein
MAKYVCFAESTKMVKSVCGVVVGPIEGVLGALYAGIYLVNKKHGGRK